MTAGENPSIDPSELELLCRRAIGGDAEALTRLLAIHHPRLRGFVQRKIGPDWRGRIDPEDLMQEAYIDIVEGIAAFEHRDEDSFYRWTTRIIEHRFIDQVRRLRRKKRDALREVQGDATTSRHESFLANHYADSMTPSRAMRRADAVAALMTCIARLPEDYRTVVRRYLLNEEPLSAIAADMQRSEDAVRRMASRALERLQTYLNEASRFFSSHD